MNCNRPEIPENFYSHLASYSSEELDNYLDWRDEDPFDSQWCESYEQVKSACCGFDTADLYQRLSKASHAHEVSSYILDDWILLAKAQFIGFSSMFVSQLQKCYEQGRLPSASEFSFSEDQSA